MKPLVALYINIYIPDGADSQAAAEVMDSEVIPSVFPGLAITELQHSLSEHLDLAGTMIEFGRSAYGELK
jgi:hypothetical protein